MAANTYGKFPVHLCQGEVDFRVATLKAMLVGSDYTVDLDNHEFKSHITDEISGTGYTAGGVTLSGPTIIYDPATNTTRVDAADANFGVVTFTDAAGIVVYVDTGTAATSILVSYHSMAPQELDGEPFVYKWHADGFVTLAAA